MILILLALTFLFPFLYKYSFVITNQFSQIPIILSFMDANYLPNDWYVSVSRTFGPRTIFAWYMAQTAKVLTLPVTFFLHYLLYIFLVIYSSYKLSYIIIKNKFIALTTTIAILFGTTITLGGNLLVTADFSAPQLPLAITLLAIVWLLEEKYLLSSLLFVVASFFHPLIGFESSVLFYSSFFFVLLFIKKPLVAFIQKAILPYLLFSLPIFFLYIKDFSNKMVSNSDKIDILAFMRNPHHFVASTFPLTYFILFLILIALFIIFMLWFRNRLIKPFLFNFIVIAILLILSSGVVGFIGTEIIKFYPLVVLQTFRLTVYLYWLAAIVILGSSLYLAINSKSRYSAVFLLPILISNTEIFYQSGKTHFIALVTAILLIIFFKKIPKKLFIFALIIYFSLFRLHDRFNFSSYITYPTEETTLALWAKENTLSSAIFLIPPEFEKFRLISNRAVVADWKSFPFQETAMLEWAKRMCEIGNIKSCNYRNVKRESVISGYRTHVQKSLIWLVSKYHLDYIITDQELPYLKKIYSNGSSIYRTNFIPF